MNQQQNTQQQQQNNTPPPKPTYKFRSWIILMPLALLILFFYILKNVQPVINFNAILDTIHIHNPERTTRLFVLMVILTAIVLTTTFVKKSK